MAIKHTAYLVNGKIVQEFMTALYLGREVGQYILGTHTRLSIRAWEELCKRDGHVIFREFGRVLRIQVVRYRLKGYE